MRNFTKFLNILMKVVVILLILAPVLFLFYVLLEGEMVPLVFNARRAWLLVKTVLLGINVSTVSFMIGFFFCVFLLRNKSKPAYILTALILTFYLISPYIHALSWLRFFSVGKLGYLKTVVVLTMYYVPLNILVVSIAFRSIDKDYLYAAKIYRKDSAVLYKILLRMLKPFAISIISLVFILVISDFSVPSLFQLKTYSFEVFTYYTSGATFKELVVMSLPLLIVNAFAFFILIFNSEKLSFISRGGSVLKNNAFKPGLITEILVALSLFGMVLLFGIILSNLFSILKWHTLIKTFFENRQELIYSIKISFVSAFLAATLLLYILSHHNHFLIKMVVMSPLLFPGALMGISMIAVFIQSPYYASLMEKDILLIYGNTIRALPIVYFLMKGSLETKDRHLIDCGKLYQRHLIHRLIHVDIPYFSIPFLGGLYVGFAYIFGEISSSILLVPPGQQLISLKIYSYLHYGSGSKISAIGLIIILFFTVVTSGVILLLNKKRRYIR